jgi:hypothetical protein
VARATPCPKNGVAGPPYFWPRGASATPIRPVWGRSHPRPLGVVRPPRKATKKKKKKGKNGFGILGGGRTTPKGLGWLRPPPTTVRPPPKSQTHFFLFFFWPFGVAGPLHFWPRGGRPPHGQKCGGPTTPFFGQGVAPATRFLPFFFVNFLFLNPKMLKTMPFWAKRRRFEQALKGSFKRVE